MSYWLLIVLAGCIALVLTGVLRRYAMVRKLLDMPNERSSHSRPTPRGGGMAIVLVFVSFMPVLRLFDVVSTEALWSLIGAGAGVALVGFWDDHRHIPARWRLLIHFAAACWGVLLLGGLPPIPLFGSHYDLGWFGGLIAVTYLVWLINLYNFMDGINGIAGVEAVTVSLGGSLLYATSPATGAEWVVPMLLLAAVSGFLFWNFPTARIFMGDAGSGFIGIILGLMSIQSAWIVPELFWGWIILLGVFITDATVTLVRRLLQQQKIYQAHRSHAYQYASRKFGSHKPVTLAVGAINLFWLLPFALLVGLKLIDGILGMLVAYGPLLWLALQLKAGASGHQEV